jgi:hypothetical protein
MKLKHVLLPIASALTMAAATAAAQVYSTNTVGYVNTLFHPGYNWFGNPFDAANNSLSALIATAPEGTTVSLWNSTLNLYTPTAAFTGGGWSSDFALDPGTGALLDAPSPFTNTFVGTVLNFDGSVWGGPFSEPPPFAGPDGFYLLSSKTPIALSGHVFDPVPETFSVFEAIIGRAPHEGEQVTTLDPLTQIYSTTTFVGGAWDNGDPSLAVGQAAMFNIGAVPEPSVLGLLAIGLGTLGIARSRLGSNT